MLQYAPKITQQSITQQSDYTNESGSCNDGRSDEGNPAILHTADVYQMVTLCTLNTETQLLFLSIMLP